MYENAVDCSIFEIQENSACLFIFCCFFFCLLLGELKIRNGVELQDFMFAQMPFFSNIIITLFNSLVD